MTLEELIKALEAEPKSKVVRNGFRNPHSYRGSYENLAFSPCEEVCVGAMLAAARSAYGAAFTGYKGGTCIMGPYTPVYLAEWGQCGEEIGPTLLRYILGAEARP